MLRSGPASATDDDDTASPAGAPENVSDTVKKAPPDWASIPATVEPVSVIRLPEPRPVSCAPCEIRNASQQAEAEVENTAPNPSDVWLTVLLVAEKSGPARVRRDGVPEFERRSERMLPEVSSVLLVKLRNGCAPVLLTWLPSRIVRRLKTSVAGSPTAMFDDTAVKSGPARLSVEPFTTRTRS